jgi:predicted TIM-barrel fold metal-dependent hydrolase
MEWPFTVGYANVGPSREQKRGSLELMTYDEMLPGCYQQSARLADMTANHTEASLCFPTVPRFCGQIFFEQRDRELGLECLRVYNDWMIDEWCAGEGYGRLIPLTLVPLWDPDLAAAEVRRYADKGSHAIAFPEAMEPLGLQTLYSGAWEEFLRACHDTETSVNMHIGSSSKLPGTSSDAPVGVTVALTHENGAHTLVDWVFSGALTRHPNIKIVLSEAQAGWLPFMLQRMDDVWERAELYETNIRETLPVPPSHIVRNRLYSCIFNDLVGLGVREQIGMQHMMFEVDYPHSDSAFPNSARLAEKLISEAGLDEHETYQFVRGNAIECYDLARWGITA